MHVEKFSVWREVGVLPTELGENIAGMQAGDAAETRLGPGEVTEPWEPGRKIVTKPSRFDRHHRRSLVVGPRPDRFYPRGFFQAVESIFKDAVEPARITGLNEERMDLDLNHPLAGFPIRVRLHLDSVLPGSDRRGGRCTSPLDDLLQYPGLAAPHENNGNY